MGPGEHNRQAGYTLTRTPDGGVLRPYLRVGSLILRPSYADEPDKIWIEQAEGPRAGEGGEFPLEQVEAVLQAYYAEHF